MNTVLWRPGLQLEPKDPDDVVLIEVQWADKLGSDTIASAAVTVSPSGALTATVDSFTTDTQILRISGGVAGVFYAVTPEVDTAASQHFERSVVVPVAEL